MKKNLQLVTLALALCCMTANAQMGKVVGPKTRQAPAVHNESDHKTETPGRICGTEIPHGEWDNWTPEQIAELEKVNYNVKPYQNPNNKMMVQYTIPVVFHIIHGGTAVGAGINISQAQIIDQINILNADYKSAGLNNSLCPAAFTSVKADCEITFCLATKDPTGAVLAEPGIHRVAYTSISGLSAPGAGYSQSTCDNIIKPATIWNPIRYFNVWVTALGGGLLGYATFPVGTTISCISGTGSSTTDGVVCGSQYIGSIGSASTAAPYNKGRTLVHEAGHWLGLRHINGDANCGNDCVSDTPTQDALHGGCISSATPYHVNVCGAGSSPNGEMTMNYMDYTDDACMYMFTLGQKARMQQCMVEGTYRNQLSASAATLCSTGPTAPTAAFNMASTTCTGSPVNTTNSSFGNPTPTYSWSSVSSTGVTFNPGVTATSPTITFANPGTYTITCKATNSVGTNSTSKVITVTTCSAPSIACNDTLSNFKTTDTLYLYNASPGYVAGNNGYGDIEKAEYYSNTGIPAGTKVMGGIALFYKHATANIGTHGTTVLNFRMYNGNNVTGPSGAALITHTNSITNILAAATATTNVSYCGDPAIGYSTAIIRPYSYNFTTAQTISGGFLLGVSLPTSGSDTAVVFMTSGNTATASTAWEKWNDNTWHPFNDGTSNTWQLNSSVAILPKLACPSEIWNPNGISGNIAIFPNPSNGVFNFAVTMPFASDLNFTVTNSIGQVVYTKVEKNVTNSVLGLDLSHLSKGIYFVNIIDASGDKATKKLIIQ
jgi:hypothetical protein